MTLEDSSLKSTLKKENLHVFHHFNRVSKDLFLLKEYSETKVLVFFLSECPKGGCVCVCGCVDLVGE